MINPRTIVFEPEALWFPKPQVIAHLLRKVHITFSSEYGGVWHQSL